MQAFLRGKNFAKISTSMEVTRQVTMSNEKPRNQQNQTIKIKMHKSFFAKNLVHLKIKH